MDLNGLQTWARGLQQRVSSEIAWIFCDLWKMCVIFTKDVEKCFCFTRNATSSFLDAYDGKSAEFPFLGAIWCKWSYNNKLPQLNTARIKISNSAVNRDHSNKM